MGIFDLIKNLVMFSPSDLSECWFAKNLKWGQVEREVIGISLIFVGWRGRVEATGFKCLLCKGPLLVMCSPSAPLTWPSHYSSWQPPL